MLYSYNLSLFNKLLLFFFRFSKFFFNCILIWIKVIRYLLFKPWKTLPFLPLTSTSLAAILDLVLRAISVEAFVKLSSKNKSAFDFSSASYRDLIEELCPLNYFFSLCFLEKIFFIFFNTEEISFSNLFIIFHLVFSLNSFDSSWLFCLSSYKILKKASPNSLSYMNSACLSFGLLFRSLAEQFESNFSSILAISILLCGDSSAISWKSWPTKKAVASTPPQCYSIF